MPRNPKHPLSQRDGHTELAVCPVCGHLDWYPPSWGKPPMCIRLAHHGGKGVQQMRPASQAQIAEVMAAVSA
jgi:hypothetical protein